MKLEDIQVLWEKDSMIDPLQLSDEALKIPKLHNVYYRIFIQERMILKKYEAEFKELQNLRHGFYVGTLDDETLSEKGWTQSYKEFGLKVLKSDVGRYLESDKLLIDQSLKIGLQKEKVDFLFSILDSIKYRNNIISNAIAWTRFTNGG